MNKSEKENTIIEMGNDIFAFLKFVKIQEPGHLALPYILWPHLIDFYNILEKYKLIDLIKAKQIGISWALAIYALWKIYTLPGWNVLEISKGQSESIQLLDKSRIIYLNLPEWMQVYTLEPNSAEKFGFKENSSRITALSSTETAGIGETAGTVIHDESDFHDCYEVNLSHTRATVADSAERQLISVSTVDKTKPDSYFKTHWKAAENGENGFKSLFYGYDVRPDRGEGFYAQLVKENKDTPWVVEANYPRTVKEALSPMSAQSCFDGDVMEQLWDNRMEQPEVKQNHIYILCPRSVGTQYIAGIDVGEGVGLDYSCLTIAGVRGLTAEVVAAIYTNTLGTDSFAFDCDKLCHEYDAPLLIVDNIGVGRAVCDKLESLGYPNLYFEHEKKVGYSLTRPKKRELAVKLVEKINDGSLATRWSPQIKELMEYQWINGYPEPTSRTHGDTIIPLMFISEFLEEIGIAEPASMYVAGKKIW
ncbi:hypothetical protein LCGC14_0808100 [marine sediment metagenome]|uniref:Terminase large subunit gp17-like C-terminal domain-containing protein n=1 Tax=marine sediment metagenome TaxID=412755 RepID=A0A0F9PS64_9ZZZZ